jgi:hypothetical protein
MRSIKIVFLLCMAVLAGVLLLNSTVITADGGKPVPNPWLAADGGKPVPNPWLVADGGKPVPNPWLGIAS